MPTPRVNHIAFVGFGEAGQILAADLVRAGLGQISAFDPRFLDSTDPGPARRARELRVRVGRSIADAVKRAEIIISAVTSGATVRVAEETARAIKAGGYFLDLNSASPGAKQRAARAIDTAGGRFVEGAVMSPIPPHGINVPIACGGPHAKILATLLEPLGFHIDVVSDEIGFASALKMCRSIMMKGMEALMVECMVVARAYGVEQQVIASLDETLPRIDWGERATRFAIGRVVLHGRRRAEEMREAAQMIEELGLAPLMASAIAERQDWVAGLGVAPDLATNEMTDYRALADALWRAAGLRAA